jgi:hypothetical protein
MLIYKKKFHINEADQQWLKNSHFTSKRHLAVWKYTSVLCNIVCNIINGHWGLFRHLYNNGKKSKCVPITYFQNSGAMPVITGVKILIKGIINIFFFTYKLCEQCICFRTLPVRSVGRWQGPRGCKLGSSSTNFILLSQKKKEIQ